MLKNPEIRVMNQDALVVANIDGVEHVGKADEWLAFARKIIAVATPSAPAPDKTALAGLKDREIEVLSLLTQGLSNKAIGSEMGLTATTANFWVKNAMRAIGVKNRTQAALWAVEHGLA